MLTLNDRIDKINAAIEKETECMNAILKDNGAEIREQLIDEDEQECWDGSFKARHFLIQQLQRIESILDTCEKHIFANCS